MEEQQSEQLAGVLACLNEAFDDDPQAMQALLRNVVPCNEDLALHPTIVVGKNEVLEDGGWEVGTLGVVNGVLSSLGVPLVASKWSEPDDIGKPTLLGFCEYKPGA